MALPAAGAAFSAILDRLPGLDFSGLGEAFADQIASFLASQSRAQAGRALLLPRLQRVALTEKTLSFVVRLVELLAEAAPVEAGLLSLVLPLFRDAPIARQLGAAERPMLLNILGLSVQSLGAAAVEAHLGVCPFLFSFGQLPGSSYGLSRSALRVLALSDSAGRWLDRLIEAGLDRHALELASLCAGKVRYTDDQARWIFRQPDRRAVAEISRHVPGPSRYVSAPAPENIGFAHRDTDAEQLAPLVLGQLADGRDVSLEVIESCAGRLEGARPVKDYLLFIARGHRGSEVFWRCMLQTVRECSEEELDLLPLCRGSFRFFLSLDPEYAWRRLERGCFSDDRHTEEASEVVSWLCSEQWPFSAERRALFSERLLGLFSSESLALDLELRASIATFVLDAEPSPARRAEVFLELARHLPSDEALAVALIGALKRHADMAGSGVVDSLLPIADTDFDLAKGELSGLLAQHAGPAERTRERLLLQDSAAERPDGYLDVYEYFLHGHLPSEAHDCHRVLDCYQ